MKPISCRISPASLGQVALQPPATGFGQRHHHCLPYRTERYPTAAKCADRLAQSADFPSAVGRSAIAATCANCWRIATFSARCCCSMTRLNCVMTSPNSLGRSALLDAAFERATLYRGRLKRLKEINQPDIATGMNAPRGHFTSP